MKIKPKKSLGQNFLSDKNIIKKIVDVGKINSHDNIIEIGPGTGNLTEFILKKQPKKIILIEKDYKLIKSLYEKFNDSVNIENEDILNFQIKNTSKEKFIIYPKPKIESTLLSFMPKKKYFNIKNPKNLEKITQIFFNKKRKMIKNPLKQIFKNPDIIANKLKLDVNLRPQNLSPLNYFEITKEYENQLIN